MKSKIFLITLALLMLYAGLATATNRALIIGIGRGYAKFGINPIAGPDKDTELAKALAEKLNFQSEEIMVLPEEKATKQAIMEGLKWAAEGVKDGGRAFIYYSGHGSQIAADINNPRGDCLEMLVPVDLTSKDKLINFRDIRNYLNGMVKAEVLFLVDACFSGTITKSADSESVENIKYYKGEQECGRAVNLKSFEVMDDIKGATKIVGMSAPAPNEVAYGDLTKSKKGSLFTQAIYDIILEKGINITFNNLRDEVAKRIRVVSEKFRLLPHTPQLGGNPLLFNAYFDFKASNEGYNGGVGRAGNSNEIVERLLNHSQFMVAIKTGKHKLSLGENIDFSIISSRDGYLNIMEVEPNGNINVIFPNKVVTENRVNANKEKFIPRDIGGFRFKAREPIGKSSIVAIVSTDPLNLYREQNVGRKVGDFKSIDLGEFSSFKEAITRSVEVEYPKDKEKEKPYGAQRITIEVTK